jgi:endonuclease/exonuclease/phosphatase family metal-dependent hydrolase
MQNDTPIRLLTYNIHSCVGTDRKLDPARIADVIAGLRPDIVALQEVDVGRRRTGGIDQAHMIASLLRMQVHFNASLTVAEEKYGDALISALPMSPAHSGPLPSLGETRGALGVEFTVGNRKIRVINTHLGLRGRERVNQMRALLAPPWLHQPGAEAIPTVLCGDFNAIPRSEAYRLATASLRDAQLAGGGAASPTFPSRFPIMRLDHVFVTEDIEVISTEVVRNRLTRLASDHLPLVAEIRLR